VAGLGLFCALGLSFFFPDTDGPLSQELEEAGFEAKMPVSSEVPAPRHLCVALLAGAVVGAGIVSARPAAKYFFFAGLGFASGRGVRAPLCQSPGAVKRGAKFTAARLETKTVGRFEVFQPLGPAM